jgi:NADH-quinone oxidoreductase subunit L
VANAVRQCDEGAHGVSISTAAWLAYASPLVGCVLIALLGFAGERVPRRTCSWLANAAMLIAFLLGLIVFFKLRDLPEDSRSVHSVAWTWLQSGTFHVDNSILIDQLSAVMLLIVTGVGFLIHLYSVGYMHGDTEERRYFAYLNLFVFSMLILVLAANFVILLVGWGMVGLSSYLLIGFWHQRPSAVAAAKKAFVMNAVGDVGMAIGIFMIFRELGTVDYIEVFANRGQLGVGTSTMNWICLLLLIGGVAKSAQLPLHTWLPDAMEGPTPVSALIHAATMVTAGVYLVARMNPLYSYAPDIQHLIVAIGVIGLLMAGLTALSQTDIKRIIAFSTMSQIAYMFVGVGLGAYWTGIFHLTTHAFFKALLFMGAGVVIHALADEQDIRQMGGMQKWLPRTALCMWIGTFTLAGVFPLSGGISKDTILASGLQLGGFWGYLAFIGGVLGALLTGLYASRLMFVVFRGEPSEHAAHHAPHHTEHGEGPWTMLVPIYILTVLSVIAGVLEFPGVTEYFYDWLKPTVYGGVPMIVPSTSNDWIATVCATAAGLIGIGAASRIWRTRTSSVKVPRALAVISERRFFWDELYDYAFYRPAVFVANGLRRTVEADIFLELPDALGSLASHVGRSFGRVQTGLVRGYALAFALGVGVLVFYFMVQAA